MRWLILILLTAVIPGKAQDSVKTKAWYVPDYAKVQFAGAIGLFSGGVGYVHAGRKMETELMLGFLPKSVGGDHLTSLTGKWNVLPWRVPLKENSLTLIPLHTGAYLSYTFGSQFNTILPERYPRGYYWWASSLRIGIFAGSRLRWYPAGRNGIGPVDFYYEIGTYDLKFISWFQNVSSLSIIDVLNISAGIKVEF